MKDELLVVVEEMRDLLRLIAEPHIAERDRKKRLLLRQIVGNSEKARLAVMLLDGSRKQQVIADSLPMSKGSLSELVKKLNEAGLCQPGPQGPMINFPISESVFSEDLVGV